jgi:hypothetical protein
MAKASVIMAAATNIRPFVITASYIASM